MIGFRGAGVLGLASAAPVGQRGPEPLDPRPLEPCSYHAFC